MACSILLTGVVRRYAIAKELIDVPNKRSSHVEITPRGGGVSIVLVFFTAITITYLGYENTLRTEIFVSILAGCAIVTVVGFWDDHQHVPAANRFIIHFMAAIISLLLLPSLPEIHFFNLTLQLSYFSYPIFALFLVWMLNLYNFMDGIDGIASIEAISVCIGAAAIIILHGHYDMASILFMLAAAVCGFLFWNWPPAKIFMGDACSGFLGFIFGLFAIITSLNDGISIWTWLILLGAFVVDATFTLIRRIFRGDKWYEAHRTHAYQILARRFATHKKVTIGVLIVNLVWLFPLAYVSTMYEYWAPLISFVSIVPLLILEIKVGAGINNK